MNDVKQEHNWVLEQANEIAWEVARRLPPFEGYSDFMFAINNYMHAGKSNYAKFMAISSCVLRFKNKYNAMQDNLWLKPLHEELAKISPNDMQVLINASFNPSPEELKNICAPFSAWMEHLVAACEDFMPTKLHPGYKHNANDKLHNNFDINFMDKVLLAGSDHTSYIGSENFLKVLSKAKVKIVVTAARGDKKDDGFSSYWPSNEAEEMTIAGLSMDMELFQIDIKNGYPINFDWDALLKMVDILKTYVEFKKNADISINGSFFQNELERIFVHCAAGRGRTGSFNALLVLLEKVYFQDGEDAKLFRNAMKKLFSNEKLEDEKELLVNKFVHVINLLRKKRGHAIESFGQLSSVIYNVILLSKILSACDENKEFLKSAIENLRILMNMDNEKLPVTGIKKYKISKDTKLHLIEDLIHLVNYYKQFSVINIKLSPVIEKLEKFKNNNIGEKEIGWLITDLLKDVDRIRKQSPFLVNNNLVEIAFKNCCKELSAWSGEVKKNMDLQPNISTQQFSN